MPGLLDIAPPEIVAERIEIRGGTLEVRGLRNREWVALLRRFPELRQPQVLGADDLDAEKIDLMEKIMPAAIAAGLGVSGDETTEELVRERLSESEQQQVFNAIMRLTNPPSPLAESPAQAGQSSAGAAETGSPRPSSS